jgi:hypothetical protein
VCNDVIVSEAVDPAAVSAWLTGRLPAHWFTGPAAVTVADGGLQVVGALAAVELPAGSDDAARAAAAAGRIARFREDTRPERMEVAREAEQKFGLPVTWGAVSGDTSILFTPGSPRSEGPPRAWGRRGDYVRV